MLKNIPPILSPELLKVLCEMGHGDEIILADGISRLKASAKMPLWFVRTGTEPKNCWRPSCNFCRWINTWKSLSR